MQTLTACQRVVDFTQPFHRVPIFGRNGKTATPLFFRRGTVLGLVFVFLVFIVVGYHVIFATRPFSYSESFLS
jgi:hypothetical protein